MCIQRHARQQCGAALPYPSNALKSVIDVSPECLDNLSDHHVIRAILCGHHSAALYAERTLSKGTWANWRSIQSGCHNPDSFSTVDCHLAARADRALQRRRSCRVSRSVWRCGRQRQSGALVDAGSKMIVAFISIAVRFSASAIVSV